MPHITIEYSANVAEVTDVDDLVRVVHEAALSTGTAPLKGLRTRAVSRSHYLIADGHPDNKFLAIWARFAPRSSDEKLDFIRTVLDAVLEFLGEAQSRIAISIEMHDIDTEFRINKNNVGPHIEDVA